MRRLGDGVEAALHCAGILAALPAGKVISGKDLAELHGLSESYLLKHLRALTAAGVAEAVPGPRGGYRLARAPEAVSMLDVVEAIDGSGPAFVCKEIRRRGSVTSDDPCDYKRACFIKSRMLAAEAAWRAALRSQTLADLSADAETRINERNKKALATFIAKAQR